MPWFNKNSPFHRSPEDQERDKKMIEDYINSLPPRSPSKNPHASDIGYSIENIRQAINFIDRPKYAVELLEDVIDTLNNML